MDLSQLPSNLKLKLLSLLSEQSSSTPSPSSSSTTHDKNPFKNEYNATPDEIKYANDIMSALKENGIFIQDDFVADHHTIDASFHEIQSLVREGQLKKAKVHTSSSSTTTTTTTTTNTTTPFDQQQQQKAIVSAEHRGDYHMWINNNALNLQSSSSSPPPLFPNENHQTFQIVKQLTHLRHVLNSVYGFELNEDSIQLSMYPGNGSQFVKHSDTSYHYSSNSQQNQHMNHQMRRITCLFYYNHSCIGGQLQFYPNEFNREHGLSQLYHHHHHHRHHNNNNNNNNNNHTSATETSRGIIEPLYNRMVLFPSENYHQVLPCFSDRYALTCWFYGNKDLYPLFLSSLSQQQQQQQQSPSSSIISKTETAITTESDAGDADESMNVIHVSICSYRDTELKNTIVDLYEKSQYPHRIRVYACIQLSLIEKKNQQQQQQSSENSETITMMIHASDHPTLQKYSHLITVSMLDESCAKGPCYARHLIQNQMIMMTIPSHSSSNHNHQYNMNDDDDDGAYYLQIDSHMRFVNHWDTLMIQQLNMAEQQELQQQQQQLPVSTSSCTTEAETRATAIANHQKRRKARVVLSTYPLGYTLPNNVPSANESFPTILIAKHFQSTCTPNTNTNTTTAAAAADHTMNSNVHEYCMLRLASRCIVRHQHHPDTCTTTTATTTAMAPPPIKSLFWAAGFSFSRLSLIRHAPYTNNDLQYIFFGEEMIMLKRMVEQGYVMYAPGQCLIYHLWSREHRPNFRQQQLLEEEEESNTTTNTISPPSSATGFNIIELSEEFKTVDDSDTIRQKRAQNEDRIMRELGITNNRSEPLTDSQLAFMRYCDIDFVKRTIGSRASTGDYPYPDHLV